jgi:hypothetical protein
MFDGILESNGFQKSLANFLMPFGEQNFPSGYRLVQDNDPKHTSKSTKKFLKKRKINL